MPVSTTYRSDVTTLLPVSVTLTGAEAIAAALRQSNCSTVFAYPGTSELALCSAIEAADELTLVNSRGDREAVFMAAGSNVLGRGMSVALIHGARGLTNALGAIADVRRSEISVLCLVGMPSTASARYLPPHGEPNLISGAATFAKAAYDCSDLASGHARTILGTVMEALETARELPPGPVLLGVPQDLLSTRHAVDGFPSAVPDEQTSAPHLTAASELLSSASRPVVLVDDYLLRSAAAEAALAEFATRLRAPVLQVAYRRGPMLFQQLMRASVPTYIGRYDPTDPQLLGIVGSADVLITLEDRNMYPRVVGHLPDCPKIAMTSNASATVKNGYLRSSDVVLVGEVPPNLHRITTLLPTGGRRADGHTWTGSRATRRADIVPACASAVEVVAAIGRGLGEIRAPVIVDDSQMLGGLVARSYHLLPASVRVFGSHGGFVGGGLATAVGLAATHPDVGVLAMVGDQGFTNGVQALATAGECKAPFVVLVCNNGASVSLRNQAESGGLGRVGAAFENTAGMSYVGIAEGFGLSTSVCIWPDDTGMPEAVARASADLTTALRTAFRDGRPHLIELTTTARPEFWAGVWSVEGFEDTVPAGSSGS